MTPQDGGFAPCLRRKRATQAWFWRFCLLGVAACAAQAGCSTSAPAIVASPLDSEPSEDLFPQGVLLVGPGPMDTANQFLPAVRVATTLTTPQGARSYKPCSGVLIHPRLVITAGHCVCWSRVATPRDQPPQPPSAATSQGRANEAVRTRARELRGVTLTELIDKGSPCAKRTTVTTVLYSPSKNGTPGEQVLRYESAEIVPHPDLEVLKGIRGGRLETVWSNADLAAIFLKKPVELEFQPVVLPPAEVREGDAIVMVGYGPGESSLPYGDRQSGANKVTRVLTLETGGVVFRAEEQRLTDGTVAAHTGFGDSGGACVKRANPGVLVGLTSIGAQTPDGERMSVFTSIYSHKAWLEQALERATKS